MPKMKVFCAWCGIFLKQVECAQEQSNNVSHGICNACHKEVLIELSKIRSAKTKTSTGSESEK
jgi:hypothetical protein